MTLHTVLRTNNILRLNSLLLGMLLSNVCMADTQVNIVGLFSEKAVVIINGGKPKTLSVGQTSDGVKLLGANSTSAKLLIEGKTKQLCMGQAASVGVAQQIKT